MVHHALIRGLCITFWLSVPSLQVAPRFACSVASLSQSPGHQLPGHHSLRHGALADYLLEWGEPSTCHAGLNKLCYTPSPSPPRGNRRLDTPSKSQAIAKRRDQTFCNTKAHTLCANSTRTPPRNDLMHLLLPQALLSCQGVSSQRSLHNAPIFRLLLKVAVNGTHQCDYSNFCGNPGSQRSARLMASRHCFPMISKRRGSEQCTLARQD